MSRWLIIATMFFLNAFLVNFLGEWLRGEGELGKNKDKPSVVGAFILAAALTVLQTAIGGHTAVGKALLEWLREAPDGDLLIAIAPWMGVFAQMFLIQGAAFISGRYRPIKGVRMIGAVATSSLATTIFVFLTRVVLGRISNPDARFLVGSFVLLAVVVFLMADVEQG